MLKALINEYKKEGDNVVNILLEIERSEKLSTNSKLPLDIYAGLVKTLNSQITSNREVLVNKLKEPSRSIELTSTSEQSESLQQIITITNEQVKAHNMIVNDFANQKKKLIEGIWKFLVESHKGTLEAFERKREGLTKGIAALKVQHGDLQTQYLELKRKIQEANKNVTSVQPSVDEINLTLRSYGFLNFEIVPSKIEKNQYQIQRQDGTIAEATLSEGEATFITFLYFLQLSKGAINEESITEERILIIDDPISSLDSTVLFVVSSLIKEIIKAVKTNTGIIKQIILLTHNVYFHKEVSFIDGRTSKTSDTNFWILRRNRNISTVEAYGMENPIKNSYELLWRELTNTANNAGVTIQNIMRRIVENYFKILGKYADDDLIKSFDTREEQEICRSLVCWINDGSHSIPDDLYVEQQDSVVEKYFEVFRKIFVQMGHEEHYNMMWGTKVQQSVAA